MSDVQLDEKVKVEIPKKYKVILHNDDYTTMDFVVELLEKVFNKNYEEAEEIMMSVHVAGFGVVDTYPKDIAYSKMEIAETMIKRSEFPLKITVEEE